MHDARQGQGFSATLLSFCMRGSLESRAKDMHATQIDRPCTTASLARGLGTLIPSHFHAWLFKTRFINQYENRAQRKVVFGKGHEDH
jgi:hypothetical protein